MGGNKKRRNKGQGPAGRGRKRKINEVDNVDDAENVKLSKDTKEEDAFTYQSAELDLSFQWGHEMMSNQDDNCEMEDINPLNIPLIVSTILKNLDLKELLQNRLVCRLWGEEAIKNLESRTKIRTSMFSNFSYIIEEMKTRSKMKSFQKTSEESELILTKSLYLHRKITPELSITSFKMFNIRLVHTFGGGKIVEELFKALGDKIRNFEMDLEIGSQPTIWKILHRNQTRLSSITIYLKNITADWICRRLTVDGHQDFFRGTEVVLPTVKSLRLIEDTSESPTEQDLPLENANSIQSLTYFLMKMLPGLEILCLNCHQLEYGVITNLLSDGAADKEFINPNPHLKQIGFPLNLNETEVANFHEKLKYPLEQLKLSLRPGLRFPQLYNWLSSMGPTLSSLDLDFVLVPSSPETFPCAQKLVNVVNLKFTNYYGPLDFIKYMKSLKTLSLNTVNLSVAFQDEPEGSYDNIVSLELIDSYSNAGRIIFAHIFRTITKYFPGLRKFRSGHVSDSNLKTLIRGCPQIEELLLVDSLITDEAFTGLTSERLNFLHAITERAKIEEMDSEMKENEKYRIIGEPRFSELKNLKRLHLSSSRIGDISLFFELTCCTNLEDLCISTKLITSKILYQAVMKMHLKKLRINHCYRITCCSESLSFPATQDFAYPELFTDIECDVCM